MLEVYDDSFDVVAFCGRLGTHWTDALCDASVSPCAGGTRERWDAAFTGDVWSGRGEGHSRSSVRPGERSDPGIDGNSCRFDKCTADQGGARRTRAPRSP